MCERSFPGKCRMPGRRPLAGAILALAATLLCVGTAFAQNAQPALAPTSGHVPELVRYFDRLQLSEPVVYRQLAVYTLQLIDGQTLRGGWLTLDAAVARGVLVVTEKGSGGSVPVVIVENRSRSEHVFIMGGEVIAGGKQTRTVRDDVVLAPGQRLELSVFCVEQHRWSGKSSFSAGSALLPQSIRKELRKGADQHRVWSEVTRNNRALGAENSTGSLALALKSRPVQDKLSEVRRKITPEIPRGTVGFIFAARGRAVGGELFGREDLARALLPKLLDSYAVDFVLQGAAVARDHRHEKHDAAIAFYNRIRRAGSRRATTPGSGAGIRTSGEGLLGDGVSLDSTLVHFGVQIKERIVPKPEPRPIYPNRLQNNLPGRPRR